MQTLENYLLYIHMKTKMTEKQHNLRKFKEWYLVKHAF